MTTGSPVITAFANGRVEFDLGEERHVQLFTERATAALAKDIVSLTTSADESAHVLDDTPGRGMLDLRAKSAARAATRWARSSASSRPV